MLFLSLYILPQLRVQRIEPGYEVDFNSVEHLNTVEHENHEKVKYTFCLTDLKTG
jgi:hypothetical protein